jgi:hypothetical protein
MMSMDREDEQNKIPEQPTSETARLPGTIPVAPTPLPQNQNVFDPKKISPIRTYQSDAAKSVKENKTSLAKMVIARQNKDDARIEDISPRSSKNIILISLSVILLIAGVLLTTFFFIKTIQPRGQTGDTTGRVPALILTEQDIGIDITRNSKEAIWRKTSKAVKDVTPRLDSLVNIYFTETKESLQPTLVNTAQLFSLLESRIPSALLRSLDGIFSLGIHSFNGNQPFLIFKTNFYENAAAGMYSWENDMAEELLPLFGITPENKTDIYGKDFTDSVIKNKDVRVLRDDANQPLLMYYFKDKKTIIITTNETTLSELLTRLSTAKSPMR